LDRALEIQKTYRMPPAATSPGSVSKCFLGVDVPSALEIAVLEADGDSFEDAAKESLKETSKNNKPRMGNPLLR
jgi:hypothetical protein